MVYIRKITIIIALLACSVMHGAADHASDSAGSSSPACSSTDKTKLSATEALDWGNELYTSKRWKELNQFGEGVVEDSRYPAQIRAIIWGYMALANKIGGNGIEQNNALALTYFKNALNIKELPASTRAAHLYDVFSIYYNGSESVEKNDVLALRYGYKALAMEESSANDRVNLLQLIAWIHFKGGCGVLQNYAKSLKYFREALTMSQLSPLNRVKALYNIARIYKTGGAGEPKDLNNAMYILFEALRVPKGAVLFSEMRNLIDKTLNEIRLESDAQAAAGLSSSSLESGAVQMPDKSIVRTAAFLGRPIIKTDEHLELYLIIKKTSEDSSTLLQSKIRLLKPAPQKNLKRDCTELWPEYNEIRLISENCLKEFLILDDIMHTPDNGVEKNFVELRKRCLAINRAFDYVHSGSALKQETLYRIARMWYYGAPDLTRNMFVAKCIIGRLQCEKPIAESLLEDYLNLCRLISEEEHSQGFFA